MRSFTTSLRLALLGALALSSTASFAQLVSGNVFLQGSYVEVGVANNGSFGSTVDAPSGYHAHAGGGQIVYNPATGVYGFLSNILGFVSDPQKDGWTVGTPAYMGDYFMPGSPQEGWKIQIGTGAEGIAYYPNLQSSGATGYTGGGGLSGANVSHATIGSGVQGVWEGTMGNLAIRQTTTVPSDKAYFIIKITLKNNGTTAIPDVYYTRTVDPDNDESWPGGSFSTTNTIVYQLPNPNGNTLVSAVGTSSTGSPYLGLGTKDCRAKCWILTGGLSPSSTSQQLYNQTGSDIFSYTQGATYTNDVGIGLTFHVEDLAPGDSTSFSYAYILTTSDLDEALSATSPTLVVDNIPYVSGDTTGLGGACGLCDTVLLGVVGDPGYDWSWFPTTGLLDTVGDTVMAVVCGPITYYAVGSGPCGVDTLELTFNPTGAYVPPPSVTSPITYCQGDVVVPLSATGGPFHWWTEATGGFPLPGPPIPNTDVAGTFTWWVSNYTDTCESVRVPIEVIIKPRPNQPVITATPNPVCTGDSLVLTATTDISATWTITGPGGYNSTNAVNTLFPVTPGHTGVYSAVATVDGCSSNPGTVNVSVNQSPALPVASYNGPICDSTQLELHVITDVSPVTYQWIGPGSFTATGGNPVVPVATIGNHAGLYTVTAISTGGCTSPPATLNVVINPIPDAPLTDSVIYCQYAIAVPLTAAGTNLTWYTTATGLDTFLTTPVPQTDTPGTTVYFVSQTAAKCESRRSPLVVTIEPMPAITVATDRDSICAGQQVVLQAGLNVVPSSITWDFGDGTSLSGVGQTNHAYENEGVYTVTLSLSFGVCPDTTLEKEVRVLRIPRIDLGRDTAMCPGAGPIVLQDYTNATDGGAIWRWSTGETTSSILVTAPGIYWSTATIGYCSATDSVEVRKDCYLDMPNVFTPNGDGTNDYFFPRQDLASSLGAFRLTIFNRWGEKVYETTRTDGRGWDGRYNGKEQPQGVYIYQVEGVFLNGKHEKLTGNVTLLR